jgi:hypothetical protein
MPMTEWRSLSSNFPDWRDSGPVRLRYKNGEIIPGKLMVADVGFNGEDEFPIFEFVSDKGFVLDIHSFEDWMPRRPAEQDKGQSR